MAQQELSVIQKAHDLILWYVPILNRLPRDQQYALGDRIIARLYEVLEELIIARYGRENHTLHPPLAAKADGFLMRML